MRYKQLYDLEQRKKILGGTNIDLTFFQCLFESRILFIFECICECRYSNIPKHLTATVIWQTTINTIQVMWCGVKGYFFAVEFFYCLYTVQRRMFTLHVDCCTCNSFKYYCLNIDVSIFLQRPTNVRRVAASLTNTNTVRFPFVSRCCFSVLLKRS